MRDDGGARFACVVLLSFAACSGGGGALDVVSGRILDPDGRPAPGVVVYVGTIPVTTDVEGRFAVPNVAVPYDLHVTGLGGVVDPGESNNVVSSTLGLTLRALPDLYQIGVPSQPPTGTVPTTIVGSVSGGSITAPNRVVWIVFCADGICSETATTAGGFRLDAEIPGPSATGKLYALEGTYRMDDPLRQPESWGMWGGAELTVTFGTTASRDLVLSTAIPSRQVTGALSVPAGTSSSYLAYGISDGTSKWMIHAQSMDPGPFSFALPFLPGFTPWYSADSFTFETLAQSWKEGVIPDGDLVVVLDDPVPLLSPPELASSVSSATEFTWTPRPRTVHSLRASCVDFARTVRTMGGTVRLPSFPGFAVTGTGSCAWTVFTYAPVDSMDAFIARTPEIAIDSITMSARRSFTIQ